MIIFNDVKLSNVAPVRVVDIDVSPIMLSPVIGQRPIKFGADFVRMSGGTRNITITLALLTNDTNIRQKQMMDVIGWARTDTEGKLELPGYSGFYLQCICTRLPQISIRKWWDGGMTLTFTCFDNPYWTSTNERTGTCGSLISVTGNAHDGPLMRIERTLSSAASNQTYSISGGESMTFSTIPAGDLVIDLNRQTAVVGNTNIMQYFAFNSDFLKPRNGSYTINGTGTIKWRERYE